MPDKPNPRWYHLTPARLLTGLLVAEGFLLLSEQFCWFPFNERKGWTVLIGVAAVCLGLLLLLFWFVLSLLFRIRFQFSIRSLLVLVLVVAVACSWFTVKVQQAKRQREAVEAIDGAEAMEAIDGAHALVQYDEGPFHQSWWKTEQPAPAWFLELFGKDFFCDVSKLYGMVEFSDQDAAHLGELSSLTRLSLDNTQITDAGMIHLKGLTSLQRLSFYGCQVTGEGFEHLKGLTNLRLLDLRLTQVTDEGLEHLRGLGSLESLDLTGTNVTNEGVERLQQALPNCWIDHYVPP